MKGTSQHAHDAVLRTFDPVASAAGKDGAKLASQLFTVVAVSYTHLTLPTNREV